MEGEGFPRTSRVRQGGEIRKLLREGIRHRSEAMELFTAPSLEEVPRFGTIVPRYGRAVVERNLLRRRLREIGRRELLPELRRKGCHADLLVRTRPQAYQASFPELRAELIHLTERLCPDASFSV